VQPPAPLGATLLLLPLLLPPSPWLQQCSIEQRELYRLLGGSPSSASVLDPHDDVTVGIARTSSGLLSAS